MLPALCMPSRILAVDTGNQPIFFDSAWHTAQLSSVSSPMMVMLVLVGARDSGQQEGGGTMGEPEAETG